MAKQASPPKKASKQDTSYLKNKAEKGKFSKSLRRVNQQYGRALKKLAE